MFARRLTDKAAANNKVKVTNMNVYPEVPKDVYIRACVCSNPTNLSAGEGRGGCGDVIRLKKSVVFCSGTFRTLEPDYI